MEQADFRYQVQQGLKRTLDIVVVVAGLLLIWPVLLLIGMAVKLDSRGPVIFRHKRVGRDGKPFYLLKFRTMVEGGDDTSYMKYLDDLIESERIGNGESLPYRKMNSDPRVTRVGKLLRTYYLDELPQAWNILKGDMSLVGPRPHVQFEVDHYTPQQRRRLITRPGATGLWQVTNKADCTFSELIALDLQYIDNWSLNLDLKILLKTFALLAKGGEGFWARMAKRIPQNQASPRPSFEGPAVVHEPESLLPDTGNETGELVHPLPANFEFTQKPLPGSRAEGNAYPS